MAEGHRFPEITILLGVGRSGTSYLTTMLRRKLKIGFPQEPKFILPIYGKLRRFGPLDDPSNLRRLAEEVHRQPIFQRYLHRVLKLPSTLDELLERVLEPTYSGMLYAAFQLMADKRGFKRLGYKDPADTGSLGLIAELFPTARFVHIIRDGRGVAMSNLKMNWGHTNVYAGARSWARDVAEARRVGASLGDRYFELRLEDLTADTERVAWEVANFINQGQNMQQVTDFVDEIVRTKSPAKAQAWEQKMNERQRYLCEAVAGDVLRDCNYPTQFEGASVSTLLGAFLSTQDFLGRVKVRLTKDRWHKG